MQAKREAQIAAQRKLVEDVRARYPDAQVWMGEHVELVGDERRSIPVVIVELPTGQRVTFLAERPRVRDRVDAADQEA
jgi:hypothetical protein